MASVKAGRYQLLEELGRGAMGVVYKAFDPVIGRTVAVKALRLNATGSGMNRTELLSRFQTETRAAGSLTHANIVSVFDAGEEDGLFYITMEYVEGASLQDRLDKGQVFPLPRILRVMDQACAGLGYAHKHSIVHRDIKPANILITTDDTLKITDFGTAKILQLGTTQSGHVIGTPSYMSPEQVKGKLVDGRSDIFSLGVILYELITGEKPFPGQNVTTVIYKIVNTEPISPKELDASVPAGLNFIVTKALAKDPDARFATCEELLEALNRYPELGPSAEETVRLPRPAAAIPSTLAAPAPEKSDSSTALKLAAKAPKPMARRRVPARPASVPAVEKTPGTAFRIARGILIFVLVGLVDIGYLYWPNIRHYVSISLVRIHLATAPAGTPQPDATPVASSVPPASASTNSAGDGSQGNAPAPVTIDPSSVGASPSAASPVPGAPFAPKLDLAAARANVERRFRELGLMGKVRVFISGTELAISGVLSRAEHNQLVEKLRAMSPSFPWADHTQIADPGSPEVAPGKGGVSVITSVAGAHALLKSPDGQRTWPCETPCVFKDLAPGNYSIEVTLSGYRTERRFVDVSAGPYARKEVKLNALFNTVLVTSNPSGAEVLINGESQKELTPATFYLPPGRCTVVARKPGYAQSEKSFDCIADGYYDLKFTLAERPAPRQEPKPEPVVESKSIGWVNVRTVPPGAQILLASTGAHYVTPKRLELPPGEYTLTLFLRGYKPVKKTIQVVVNKETSLNEPLVPSSP